MGDPFLTQEIRYHCPVYGIFNFSKPKHKSYVRHTWSFEQGDYNLLRGKASLTNWDHLYDADINKHAQNISNQIMIAKECIPKRKTRIKPDEPVWIKSEIRRLKRKRKRAFRKAKRTNLREHWVKFKQLRNRVINLIRDSKQSHKDKIANKLRSGTLSSRDWWHTLKSVIAPNSKSSIPPLEKDGILIVDDVDKANVLNDFFRDQTIINDNGVELPQFDNYNVLSELSSLHLTPDEIETVLKSLPVGKAAGPDGINNRILRELARVCSLLLSLQPFSANWRISWLLETGTCESDRKRWRHIFSLQLPSYFSSV